MFFPDMEPFIFGDMMLKQPCGSSFCLTTCIDIAVAYAFYKVTGALPEIYSKECEFQKIGRRNHSNHFKSTVNILRGGFNEERIKCGFWDNGLSMLALQDCTLDGIAKKVLTVNGMKSEKINFKEEKSISSVSNLKEILNFFLKINLGKENEQQKDRGICIFEFVTPCKHSHACMLSGIDVDKKDFYIYNPEISYLPHLKEKTRSVTYRIPGKREINVNFRTLVFKLSDRLNTNDLMYGRKYEDKKNPRSKPVYSFSRAKIFSF